MILIPKTYIKFFASIFCLIISLGLNGDILAENLQNEDNVRSADLYKNIEEALKFLHEDVSKIILDVNLIKTKSDINTVTTKSRKYEEYFINEANIKLKESKKDAQFPESCSLFLVSTHFRLVKKSLIDLYQCDESGCGKENIDKEQARLFLIGVELEKELNKCVLNST